MDNTRKRWTIIIAIILFSGTVYIGCASSASLEEIKSLNDVQAEINSLEQQQIALQQKRSMLAVSIQTKVSHLKEITDKKNALLTYQ